MSETENHIHCQVVCHLMLYKNEIWPDSLCMKPEVDQYVESESGVSLKIKKIAHASKTTMFAGTSGSSGNKNSFTKPILKIYVG